MDQSSTSMATVVEVATILVHYCLIITNCEPFLIFMVSVFFTNLELASLYLHFTFLFPPSILIIMKASLYNAIVKQMG